MTMVQIAEGIQIEVPEAPWNLYDRAAWYCPEPMPASEWSQEYRYLDRGEIPGPWRNDNAPYLPGIMNVSEKRGVVRQVIMKAVQMGVSEAMRCLLAKWAHMDPSSVGLLLPNRDKGEQIVQDDVIPCFRQVFGPENIKRHPHMAGILSKRPHDLTKGEIRLLNGFILYLMWSGSPASLASNPMRRCISDEVDKFEPWSGNDADPISLADFRLSTAAEPLHILISTPTLATGQISTAFEACTLKLYFLVPCPHCGCRQRLVFGDGGDFGVKWSEGVRKLQREHEFSLAAAEAMGEPGAVWYECCECHGRIDERQKRMAVRAGKWGTVGEDKMRGDGVISDFDRVEECRPGTHVGMQIGGEYATWRSLAQQAADFLAARTFAQKFGFRTSRQGMPWEEIVQEGAEIDIAGGRGVMEEGKLPWWTARLIAVIDTQKDHFWVVIRAWGPGMRSQRIWHNKVQSFADLERICFQTPFENEDTRLPPRVCDLAVIDSGGGRSDAGEEVGQGPAPSRVMEVYRWCLANQARVRAIKGDSKPKAGIFIRPGVGVYSEGGAGGAKRPLPIWLLDVHHFQDYLVDLMAKRIEGGEAADMKSGEVVSAEEDAGMPAWRLNTRNDGEYNHHMENLHKVRRGVGAEMEWRWEPVREGLRVDYRACEGYSVAAAEMLEVPVLPSLGAWRRYMEEQLAAKRAYVAPPANNPYAMPDGRPYLVTER